MLVPAGAGDDELGQAKATVTGACLMSRGGCWKAEAAADRPVTRRETTEDMAAAAGREGRAKLRS